jgi:hypothetical protein
VYALEAAVLSIDHKRLDEITRLLRRFQSGDTSHSTAA